MNVSRGAGLADKPEFVDLISEATRQNRRSTRASSISTPSWSRKPRVSVTGPSGSRRGGWRRSRPGSSNLEIQELGLTRSPQHRRQKAGAPRGSACFVSGRSSPIAVVMPAVMRCQGDSGRSCAAVIGPDHPAVTVRIGISAGKRSRPARQRNRRRGHRSADGGRRPQPSVGETAPTSTPSST